MGYRNYLGSLPKKEYNKIKNFSLKELYEFKGEEWSDDPNERVGYVGVYDVAYNSHYELGKYVDSFDKKFFKPVFKNKETQNDFLGDHDFYIVEKEFVLMLIEHYTELVRNYYKKLLTPFFDENGKATAEFLKKKDTPLSEFLKTKDKPLEDVTSVYEIISHVKDMSMEWGLFCYFKGGTPYDASDNPRLVSSWKYEYEIFQLVHFLKTFDFKKNVLIYYGY